MIHAVAEYEAGTVPAVGVIGCFDRKLKGVLCL